MIAILIARHLIHFCICIVFFACVAMWATLEESTSPDFDLELDK